VNTNTDSQSRKTKTSRNGTTTTTPGLYSRVSILVVSALRLPDSEPMWFQLHILQGPRNRKVPWALASDSAGSQ